MQVKIIIPCLVIMHPLRLIHPSPMPGTCLSFSREDSTQFVVGSENGGLFKCSLPSLDSTRVDEHTGEGGTGGGAGGIKCAAYIMYVLMEPVL